MEQDRTHTAVGEVERAIAEALERGDLRRALGILNARTNLRFTGVYRFEPPLLRSICLFDRENPTLPLGGDAARLDDTFCSIVRATHDAQLIEDAGMEPRHVPKANRSGVLAYCGVPLTAPDGQPFGTLCHFDLRPRIIPAGELQVLRSVAPVVMRTLEAQGWRPSAPTRRAPGRTSGVSERRVAAPPDSGGR